VALMNLYRIARPLNTLRLALVLTMSTLFGLAFVLPWSRDLFELPLTQAWAYGVAAGFIAVAWPLLEFGGRWTERWYRPADHDHRGHDHHGRGQTRGDDQHGHGHARG